MSTAKPTKNGNALLPLEAEAASINTATITIRALHVGKKQMTQSVFRQLPVSPLVDEDKVELLGVPWGWVNYHWGDIDPEKTHFIHQIGGRLYRDAFLIRDSTEFRQKTMPPPILEVEYSLDDLYQLRHFARFVEGWRHPGKSNTWDVRYRSEFLGRAFDGKTNRDTLPKNWSSIERLSESYFDDRVAIYVKQAEGKIENARRRIDEHSKSHKSPYENSWHSLAEDQLIVARGVDQDEIQRTVKKEQDVVLDEMRGCLQGKTVASLEAEIAQEVRFARDYCRRWDALMDQLRTVEQLFIAV